jgi:NAD(P)-dependent dehydrogenase (short-subunit alcohol dehydrogenase family)
VTTIGTALVTGAPRGLGAHIARRPAGYVAAVPLGRMGTPQDVADVVASDASRFVTGEQITVNGGRAIG